MHACCRIPVRIRRDRTERRLETCSSVPAVSCRLRPCPADSAMGRRRGHVCGHDLLAERPVPAGARICKRTGGVRCLYGRTVRPGWGNRTPVGSHPAVFKTAAIPFRQIRRWWRPLPPNLSARRVSICTPPASGSAWDFGGFQGFGMGRPHRGRLWTSANRPT